MTETSKKKKGFFSRLFETDLPDELRERSKKALEEEAAPPPDEPPADTGPAAHGEASLPQPSVEPVTPFPSTKAEPQPVELRAAEPEPLQHGIPAPPPSAPAEPVFSAEPAPAQSAPQTVATQAAEPRLSWFDRLRGGLKRSSTALSSGITDLFGKKKLDDETLDCLEDLLLQADLGIDTATRVVEAVSKGRYNREIAPDEVKEVLAEEVASVLAPVAHPLQLGQSRPHVILVVGVNGSGKTTTIGKLSAKLRAEGRDVMLVAGDTFRAAAVEQIRIWGERTGAPIVSRDQGADAAGLAFDALTRAKTEGVDVLVMDTAGRLQNRAELMAELEKIVRVMKKVDLTAPHTVLLVLDATVGQNALSQVEIFRERAGVTGLVMTKLDGTARGGILAAIAARHALPVHFIGVGEGVDDLEPFEARDFARAMVGLER